MTPDQYRAAIARLELSQVKASVYLGIDQRTSRRYASGDAAIPRTVEQSLGWAIYATEDLGWPLAEAREIGKRVGIV